VSLAYSPALIAGRCNPRDKEIAVRKIVRSVVTGIIGSTCSWVCEFLEPYANRCTTGTKLIAGDAIAVARTLDLQGVLVTDDLPPSIEGATGVFSSSEWQEVMTFASSSAQFMESELANPRWARLRRS
jgi:hypothetical protein